MSDLISRQAVSDTLAKIEAKYPYKIYGDRSTYSQYNEGWSDAVAEMDRYLLYLADAEPEERTAKATAYDPNSKSFWATDGRCEGCGCYLERKYTFCPMCGARLEWK